MNCENYYDKRNGGYVVHFPNNKGIDKTEINKMFSAYGSISSINNHSGRFGLYFVKYQSKEEAIKCIEGFKNNKDIKILPHKNKLHKKSINSKYTGSEVTSNNSYNSKKLSKNVQEEIGQKKNVDNISVTSECDHNSTTSSRSSIKHLLQRIKIRSSSSVSSEISDQNSSIMDSSLPENEAPDSIFNGERKLISAQEVIVANVHPNTKVFDILYLFEDYCPICISFIMQVPNTEIRYCRIYFETLGQASSVEKRFDKYSLHGKILIVLRPETIIREALST